MNLTHLHLLLNHLPIFGSILGGFVLFYGLYTKSNPTKMAAYFVLIASSLGAVITYLTGEPAEESIENIQGISKSMIEEHEEFAGIALVALIILGVASLVGLFLTFKKSPLTRTVAAITLVISLISFGLIARAGYIGGLIRHTEINANATPNQGAAQDDDD